MRSDGIRHLAALLVAATFLSTLAGCGGKSETQLIASAKNHLAAKDVKSAVVELKAALQKQPDSGEARYLLGKALLDGGDARGAMVELNKAHDLHFDDNRTLVALAEANLAAGLARVVSDSYADTELADPKAAAELKAQVAAAYIAQGNVDRCQAMVTVALALDPKNVEARLLQARLTAGNGGFNDALSSVNAMLAEDPKQAQAWILKAELLATAKSDVDGGIQALRSALAVDKRQMRAHVLLVQLLLQKNDMTGFKAQVAELTKLMPTAIESRYYNIEVALVDGDLKKASDGAGQLLRVAPEYPPALQLAGAVELQSGALTLAQTHLTQAIQLAPNVPLARRLLAQTNLRLGEPGKALKALEPLLAQKGAAADVFGLAGDAYIQNGDMPQAEKYYALAAQSQPGDVKSRVALALMQVTSGDSQSGLAQLDSLAATDKTTYADLALISALIYRRELVPALKAVDRLQAKAPAQPLPPLLRGRIQLLNKDPVAARASFEQALKVDAVYFPAVAELGALDVAQNKLDDAGKRFETLLAREPSNYRARLALADLRLRAGAKSEEVEKLLVAAIKASPEDAEPRLALVNFNLHQKRAAKALTAAQDAVAAIPDSLAMLDALGRAQWAAGDTQQAISTFQKMASLAKSPEPYLRLADLYAGAKDYRNAERNLRKALEITPELLAAQRGLAQIALDDKRPDDALKVAAQVKVQRPNEPVGYLMEADIRLSQRRWDAAAAALRAALERDKSSGTAQRLYAVYGLAGRTSDADRFAASWLREHPSDADFLFHLGSIAMDRRDYAGAEARYRQVLTLVPENAAAMSNVAWLLARQGKPGALEFVQHASKLAPDQPSIMDTMATVLATDRQMALALDWQRKAVAKAPDYPAYRLNLAKLLIATGDKAQARSELEKLAALGGRFDKQPEVSSLLKGL